jgi:hypothetical protein
MVVEHVGCKLHAPFFFFPSSSIYAQNVSSSSIPASRTKILHHPLFSVRIALSVFAIKVSFSAFQIHVDN